jgi:hypothetical protein
MFQPIQYAFLSGRGEPKRKLGGAARQITRQSRRSIWQMPSRQREKACKPEDCMYEFLERLARSFVYTLQLLYSNCVYVHLKALHNIWGLAQIAWSDIVNNATHISLEINQIASYIVLAWFPQEILNFWISSIVHVLYCNCNFILACEFALLYLYRYIYYFVPQYFARCQMVPQSFCPQYFVRCHLPASNCAQLFTRSFLTAAKWPAVIWPQSFDRSHLTGHQILPKDNCKLRLSIYK